MKSLFLLLFLHLLLTNSPYLIPAHGVTNDGSESVILDRFHATCPIRQDINIAKGPAWQHGFELSISGASPVCGETVCLPVSTHDFTNIYSMQFSIAFDASQLQLVSVQKFNLPDMSVGSFGLLPDRLAFAWFKNDFTGVTVPDGTVIFEICFDVIGSNSSVVEFTDDPVIIEIVDPSGQLVSFTGQPAVVDACVPPPCPSCGSGNVKVCKVINLPTGSKIELDQCLNESAASVILSAGGYCGACDGSGYQAPQLDEPPVLQGINIQEDLRAYPNPVRDRLTVVFDQNFISHHFLRLMDLNGRNIQNKLVAAGELTTWIDVHDLAPGVYILQVENTNGRQYLRISVQ